VTEDAPAIMIVRSSDERWHAPLAHDNFHVVSVEMIKRSDDEATTLTDLTSATDRDFVVSLSRRAVGRVQNKPA
jgi:hypothetical protein